MLARLSFTVVSLLSMLIASPAGASAPHKRVHKPVSAVVRASPVHRATQLIPPSLLAAWKRVNVCEEGGNWNYWSWWYPDGLGIDRPNFVQFGGNPNKVNSVAQQISVGQRFVAYYHMAIPDEYVCGPY